MYCKLQIMEINLEIIRHLRITNINHRVRLFKEIMEIDPINLSNIEKIYKDKNKNNILLKKRKKKKFFFVKLISK